MPFPGFFPPPLPCETPAAEVASQAASALTAYGTGDDVAFYAGVQRAQAGLGCVHEALSPAQAAVIHQAMGVLAFSQSDTATAVASLRAAMAARPERPLPDTITSAVPQLDALQRQATAAGAPTTQAFSPVLGARTLIDGKAASAGPTDAPYLLQVLWDSDQNVHWTGYFPVGSPAPTLTLLAPPPEGSGPGGGGGSAHKKPSVPLTVGALGTTVLAAGLYGFAVATNQQFWDEGTTEADLPALQARANALQWAALGTGVVGLSLDSVLAIKVVSALRD